MTPTVGLGWALARRYNGCLLMLSSASVSIADADYRRQLQLVTSDPVAYYSTPQPSVALLAEHQTQQLRTRDAFHFAFYHQHLRRLSTAAVFADDLYLFDALHCLPCGYSYKASCARPG